MPAAVATGHREKTSCWNIEKPTPRDARGPGGRSRHRGRGRTIRPGRRAGGGEHALAIGSGGQVWAWGRNADGELGDGTLVNRPTPQPVPGVTGITQIAAGNGFSLALRSDGTVWAWGDDRFGELGDGTTAARSTPAPVAALTGVTQVSSGLDHTLAIAGAKHAVWGWGDNSGGEIGDGTRINRLSPVPLGLLPVSGIVSLDAGVFESAGIRSDGRLMTWGDQVITPTVVSSLIGVTRVSLGDAIDLVVGQPAFVAVPDLQGDSGGPVVWSGR